MGIAIDETDEGTKGAAMTQFDRAEVTLTMGLRERLDAWWDKVVMDAISLCPVDTGTLAATIRREPAGYEGTQGEMVASAPISGDGEGLDLLDEVLVAGGLLVNPKSGRICDYAYYVHEGHYTGRCSAVHETTGSGFTPPHPFLTDAIDMNMDELDSILTDASQESESMLTKGNITNKSEGEG